MAQWLALVCAGTWALLSLYLTLAERPRQSIDLSDPGFIFYLRVSSNGAPFLVFLIFLGCAAGIYAWLATRSIEFVVGALLLLVMFPLSAMFVTPVSGAQLESRTENVGAVILQLFRRWWLLHVLRTLLALIAFGFFAAGLLG